ncbi:MAG: RICIN domain-containing protein [Actinomycetota bacterium]|nr:RICIN domain-containing protein [Actinomycetota bacterium]
MPLASGAPAAPGQVTTFAGSVGEGFATRIAQSPTAVAVRGMTLYVADYTFAAVDQRSVVRALDLTTGQQRAVAGSGFAGFSGDGGPAISAQLNDPKGLAVDGSGRLYISDRINARVRRVDATGVITTVVGDGEAELGDGGPAADAGLYGPTGLAFDAAGNLYIADTYNHRVRRVDVSTGIITTVAGTGPHRLDTFTGDGRAATETELSYPTGVVVDGAGNLFIAEGGNSLRVRKVDSRGMLTTVGGGGTESGTDGPATAFRLSPYALMIDGHGHLVITDFRRVQRIDASGRLTTVAGHGGTSYTGEDTADSIGDGGPATAARIIGAMGLAEDAAGNLYIAEQGRVRRVDMGGVITTVAGNGNSTLGGDGGLAVDAQLVHPKGVAVDPQGNVIVADTENDRVRKVTPNGIITTLAGRKQGAGSGGEGVPATAAELSYPEEVAADGEGNVYIGEGSTVRKVDRAGVITRVAGNTMPYDEAGEGGPATKIWLHEVTGVAVDASGNLFVSEPYRGRIGKVDRQGRWTTVAGGGASAEVGDGGPATAVQLAPGSVHVDAAGNLFTTDFLHQRVRKIDPQGIITTVAGNGTRGGAGDGGPAVEAELDLGPWNTMSGVAVDSAGNVFIAEAGRIRKVDGSGIITTLVAAGVPNDAGDPATSGRPFGPADVALDGAGSLYFPDVGNNRIRRIEGVAARSPAPTIPSTTTTLPATTTTTQPAPTTTTAPPTTTTTTVVPPMSSRSMLVAAHSAKFMHAPNTRPSSGTSVLQWTMLGGTNQEWRLLPLGGGIYAIASVGTGAVLDVGVSTVDGGRVLQSQWNGSVGQWWRLVPFGPNGFVVVSVRSGKVVDVLSASKANGAPLVQWSWNGGANQIWLNVRL